MGARMFKTMSYRLRLLPAVTTIACALSVAAIASPQSGLTSLWRTQPITVDGAAGDWSKLDPVPRGPEVGVMNDDEFLYLAVSTTDESLRALLSTGLIVWLDPAGGKAQTFGVWVPGFVLRPLPGAVPPPADSASNPPSRTFDRFDLLGPGKSQRRLVDLTPAMGIALASGIQESKVIYELKIPLAKTAERPYAVSAVPGRPIGLGIATPEAPKDRSGRREPLVGSSGTIGGNPYHGGGFAPFRERPENLKPIEAWTTIRLATK